MKRLLFAVVALAVVAYVVDNVREVIRTYERQAGTADTVARIRQTGPGWQR
jgi:hypothetical protein